MNFISRERRGTRCPAERQVVVMKKKSARIWLLAAVPVLLAAGLLGWYVLRPDAVAPEDDVPNTAEADWVKCYQNVEEMYLESDLVIQGQVTGSSTEERFDVIFTNQEVKIKKVYRGDLAKGDIITVQQTGGRMNGITTNAFREAPLMKRNGNYLLFLQLAPEGFYLVAGGYQGSGRIVNDILECDGGTTGSVVGELSGKSVEAAEAMLAEQGKKHPKK